jgi:ligand-binding SRPBCC domain-containing protein
MFTLKTEQWVPKPLPDVFAFFANPQNLRAITPPKLDFRIVKAPAMLQAGSLIDYRLRVRGIQFSWQSEISVWEPTRRFVDIQRRGPYRSWSHEHTFQEQAGGTLTKDSVEYNVLGGQWVQRLFVARELEKIFNYRRDRLREIFG